MEDWASTQLLESNFQIYHRFLFHIIHYTVILFPSITLQYPLPFPLNPFLLSSSPVGTTPGTWLSRYLGHSGPSVLTNRPAANV